MASGRVETVRSVVPAISTVGTPSFYEALADIRTGVRHFWDMKSNESLWNPKRFLEDLRAYGCVTFEDCAAVLMLALLWTAIRYGANSLILQPFVRWAQLKPLDARKFPESAFKCLVYTFTWSWTCYVIFVHDEYNQIFYDHLQVFSDWSRGMSVAPVLYWMYMTQMALYVHSAYATIFMDMWRKDSVVLLFHHALTMALIGFSYAIRFHRIGVLVLFMHDVTDILLEFTKCQVYLKKRGGRYHRFNDVLSTVGFLGFTAAWILFRLYWMPLKVLHAAGYGGLLLALRSGVCPFYFFFNGMLWMLQLLHVYWFTFVVNLLYKVATGQMKELDDVREEDVLQLVNKQKRSPGAGGAQSKSPDENMNRFSATIERHANSSGCNETVNANGSAAINRYSKRDSPLQVVWPANQSKKEI